MTHPATPVPITATLGTLIRPPAAVKPGIKTTEFLAAQVLSLLIVLGQAVDVTQLPSRWAGVLVVALQVAYIASRGLAKLNAGAAPASVAPDVVGELVPIIEDIVARHAEVTTQQLSAKVAAAVKPRAPRRVAAIVPTPEPPTQP